MCATIRLLGAWLSEETLALREDVYDVLPFILTVANETFESQKLAKLQTLPGRGSTDFSNFTEETMLQRQGVYDNSSKCFIFGIVKLFNIMKKRL